MSFNLSLGALISIIAIISAVYTFGAMIWSKQDKKDCEKYRKETYLLMDKVNDVAAKTSVSLMELTTRFDLQNKHLQSQIDNLEKTINLNKRFDVIEEHIRMGRN